MRPFCIPFLLVFTISVFTSNAQSYRLSADFKYGKMLNIHPFFPEVSNSINTELRLGWLTGGKKKWHYFYNYPESGLSFSYSNLGNNQVLGNAYSVFPYLNFTPFQLSRKTRVEFRTGLGMAYFDKPFNAISNPDNFVIGSRFSAAVTLYLGLTHQMNNWSVSAGAAFWHYSNGHIAVPNIGANTPYVSVALSRYINDYSRDLGRDTLFLHTGLRYNVTLNLGVHEVEGTVLPYDGPRYPVYGGTFHVSKRINYKSRLRFGIGYSYYTAFRDYILSQEIFDEKINWNSSKLMIILGHEFVFGRLTFLSDAGFNVHFPLKKEIVRLGLIPNRGLHNLISAEIGFNYYFKDISESSRNTPFVGIGLRSIGGKADFVLMRCGFVF